MGPRPNPQEVRRPAAFQFPARGKKNRLACSLCLRLPVYIGLVSRFWFSQYAEHTRSRTYRSDADYFGDIPRAKVGLDSSVDSSCPYPGANRFMTVFVYLNDVEDGGRTQWRWTTGKKTVSFPTFDSQMIILTKTGSGQT